MNLIYIKLGTASEFADGRLGINLVYPNQLAAAVDYSNLTPGIHSAINSGALIQITEREYNGIISSGGSPIRINTGQLVTLQDFQDPCPVDNFIMFGYYQGLWKKILWSTLKSCLAQSNFCFNHRVLETTDSGNYPQPGSNTFQLDDLIGLDDPTRLVVTLNGAFLYHISLYEPESDETDYEYYDIDPITGDFLKNSNFEHTDLFSIQAL